MEPFFDLVLFDVHGGILVLSCVVFVFFGDKCLFCSERLGDESFLASL